MRRCLFLLTLSACGSSATPPDAAPPPAAHGHSSSIALSRDGKTVYVVNPDADSVAIIDTTTRTVTTTIQLGSGAPVPDVVTGAYTPAIMPRALALSPNGQMLYVTGERSNSLYAIALSNMTTASVVVGSEPIGVEVSGDGSEVFVACSQDASVVEVSSSTLAIATTISVPAEPWSLAWSESDGSLLVTHLLGPGITSIDTKTGTAAPIWTIPPTQPRGDARLAHGQPRGMYDLAPRPGTDELWVAHVMLGIDTAQPALDFESTVFPSLSILNGDGSYRVTLSTDAADIPGTNGSFADIVSGPHAIAFTSDGAIALVVDTNSEDVLAIDARTDVEAALLRPLPGHMPEGIVISPDDQYAYIDERNSYDVAVVRLDHGSNTIGMSVDGAVIAKAADPMPVHLRFGQHLFYSANSDEYPITKNHWVACASCHQEGRSDAVTWDFAQGPRDTPTNAGGMLATGFLFRTADRNKVQDYWHTVNIEQGGNFDPVIEATLLDAIADYVNLAIPAPIPPTTNPTLVAQGKIIFERSDVGCATCHNGPAFTDSGQGNPTLDLAGTVLLHDVGTCVTTGFPDVDHVDVDGDPRAACMFDTPSLIGVASTPPYLHDGSAATLLDVLEQTRGKMGDISSLSATDEAALVEYMRSL